MNIIEEKQKLRRQQKKRLDSYDPDDKKDQSILLYQDLFESNDWLNSETIAVTLSLPLELNTKPIVKQAWELDKRVLVPKIIDKKMIFVEFDETSKLAPGKFHTLEPETSVEIPKEEIELMIVPGLAFTKSGKRLGFGAGFYDRYLADYSGRTVSLVLKDQLLENIPNDKLDIRIKKILTPKD
ncbi:5-formyltetrahydrofolate cyclo-ligase [Oenococcus oeni]|uniref:5-formyltetrahydrofolate cyclo-ligase n=1 Tax=Oenococcus oeni TaxID=1247 RepID=UPI00050E5FF8|nr:5-formyltetrahydrofolate cyclo-ligase [Oenococcus oeni]KGI00212.1 5-formyltetrahydrofolate cyclo-ligase [Oenococcus oeni IOEB_C52]OIM24094.1 5-formyltetrahydrofolate cyclo-ligase [Oenococcus oeni]OIM26979.1 5-formyltetrahydrofolate cyclo-ligase [Oenococcus oeni]SYW11371.1 5-formyltetrahydrofolate cyclo-ligase [Oenococcus oeni]SYW11551.1 5-formyltetrahydrofolate cyclo-ligase [Oenococcus oeni]